jgi:methyl-accepting chemotaxis protein
LSDGFDNIYGENEKISVSNFPRNKSIDDLFLSKSGSLSNFLAKNSFTPFEIRRAFFDMKKSLDEDKIVVIATSANCDENIFKKLILKRAEEEVIMPNSIYSVKILNTPSECIHDYDAILEKYNAKSLVYKNVILDKYAGSPIPDDIKQSAKNANKILTDLKKQLDSIKDDFKNNSDAYTKIKDKPKVVSGSKEAFQVSSKRISKKIVSFLLGVKKTIKIMTEIKDISSVDEKIEALSLSCKEFVDTAEDIFAMVSKIEEPNFVDQFVAESTKIDKSIEDVDNNLNNFSDYILKNILNKKVLSR